MVPTPDLDFSAVLPIVGQKNQLHSKWNLIFSKTSETAWISFKPQLGVHVYPCYACRDMFVSKATFQDHINRRAILIKYNCRECNDSLTFYNRCSFLFHARNHFTLSEGKIDFANLEMFNMPFGLLGFLPHPGINILFDVEEDTIEKDRYINAQFYSPEENEKGKQIVTLKPNDLLFCGPGENSTTIQLTLKQISSNIPLCEFVTIDDHKKLKQNVPMEPLRIKEEINDPDDGHQEESPAEHLPQLPVISKIESLCSKKLEMLPKCPECKIVQNSMQTHFVGKNMPFDERLKCSLCKYVASTKCSYSAHMRIHSNTAPYICPECGKKFESREYMMKHLDDVCFHLAKQVRIRCTGRKCGKLFATPATFSVHFTQHIKSCHQCSVCNKCFDDEVAFSEHARFQSCSFFHCTSNRVYKCLGCKVEGSIIFEDNVKQHLDYHTTDRSRYMYVFVCKFCRNFFRSTGTYAIHLCKCQKMQTMKQQVNSYSIDLCVQCHSRIIFYDDETIVTCTKCRCVNSLYTNQKNNSIPSKGPSNDKIIPCKIEVCLLCNEEYPANQKEEHKISCVYGSPKVVVKTLDNELSPNHTYILSDSIFENERKIYSTSDTSRDSVERSDGSQQSPKNNSPTNQDSLKRKRKRAAFVYRSKKVILSSPPEKIIDLQAEEAKPFDGTYYCKMCDFQECERDKFQLHIISHRHIPTDYQCMDCGECFVVKPSLIKHLKHYHKIEDTDSYLENNDCFDKNAVEELREIMQLAPGESRDPVNENQCRVCLQEFDDNHELKKHFRMHGMAFLMRNSRDSI